MNNDKEHENYSIRAPWDDEIPRIKPFLRGIEIVGRCKVRVALVGRFQKIVGVALLVEGKETTIVRERYQGTKLEIDLNRSLVDS